MATKIRREKEVFIVRNEEIEVEANFRFDIESGEKISDNYLDNLAIQKAFQIYREKNNIINEEELKEIRKKYGLSQRAFAKLTGIGAATIARYETGQIPTNANNELLKSIKNDFRVVKKLFEKNKDYFSEKEQMYLNQVLKKIAEENSVEEVIHFVEKRNKDDGPSIYTGYKKLDFDKFKHMVLFFADELSYLSKTKLNKLLFYSDFKYFQEYILSITGISYQKDYYGPVPTDFEILFSALYDSNDIRWTIFPNGKGEYIQGLTSFDPSLFTEDELLVLKQVVKNFKVDNAEIISEKSHEENGYQLTNLKEKISYDYADELKHI